MKHELPPLPYAKDALSPFLSAETIEYHWGKHHQAYVNNLNNLIVGTEFEEMTLNDIIKKASGGIYNNSAQVFNHTFYWNCLKPAGEKMPSGKIAHAIDENFGSFNAFKEIFTHSATSLFGSGWVWLIQKDNKALDILATPNAGNPLTEGYTPLLNCDVWEHAYYIDYRNARPKYLEVYWDFVNWEFVANNFKD